jgi:uncharacterized phage protein gp47/JayE
MAFGLSDEGFEAPRTSDFLDLIRNDYATATGLAIDWERDVFLGQITAIMASRLGELADAVQAVYDATDPSNATGAQLDNLAILVGILRKVATYSQANVVLSGIDGTNITAGRVVQGGADTSTRWILDDDITLGATVLTTGDLTFVAGGATTNGTITRTTGVWGDDGVGVGTTLTIAGSTSNDVTFIVEELQSDTIIGVREGVTAEGPVTATATGAFASGVVIAEDKGALAAAALAIDTIVTPVAGWTAISNPAVATTGTDIETDDELRNRRQTALAVSGAASIIAIRSNLLELTYITAAVVIENDTMTSAVIGGKTLPAKSFSAIVTPNTLSTTQQEEVALTIYTTAPAGIEIVGTDVVADVTGSDGFVKVVAFDYATPLTVNVVTTVVLDTGFVLANVSSAVEGLVTDYFNGLTVGQAVRTLELSALVATVVGVVGASFTLNGGAADIQPVLSELATLGTNTVTE